MAHIKILLDMILQTVIVFMTVDMVALILQAALHSHHAALFRRSKELLRRN
ncbi:hypothetical protein [Peribacillus tepidiphilus]|uniref:hypothetical protein n=1 Tax=Peribacillus tepidiphilus TaxID=2652445 RepID=UPI0035B5569D